MNTVHRNPAHEIPVSIEEINAFIDDELICEDRQRVRDSIKHNPELTQLICDIDQVQDWVREAYQTVPAPARMPAKWRLRALVPGALAAMTLLTVGALAGWFANQMATAGPGASAVASWQAKLSPHNSPETNPAQSLPGSATAQPRNVILRLGSDSPEKFQKTLTLVTHLLKTSAQDPGFQLEVLTNSDGLNFLRSDTSPYAQQIEALIAQYPNVHFMVCGTSVKNLEKTGKKLNLLPNVSITDSAVEQVAKRMGEGWAYSAI
ncbi:MAG: DsrE family protein [Halothiobacillaceae bacterium]|nr:DsrE family protein [Halothiobacillaceae bacterium]